MNKVGVVSVRNYNYGSILQAYAFQKVLFRENIDNEIIYYIKKTDLKQLLRILNMPLLKSKLKSIWKKIYGNLHSETGYLFRKRDEAFANFVFDNLVFSAPYLGRKALKNATKNYSSFILGSDQVWNPINLGSDFYTLTFIPDSKLKVTYASSFGVEKIPYLQRKKTISYLSRINEISVRETGGQKLIYDMINREVPVVVDPTLLLSSTEWDVLLEDEILDAQPYILAYFVGANEEHRRITEDLKGGTGLKIILIPHIDELVKADKRFVQKKYSGIGPCEFVNLIRHANYICTDSFHATVFSILYQKKFFVFDRYRGDERISMNSRLSSLLGKLNLTGRMVSGRPKLLEWRDEEIDYSAVGDKVLKFRTDSEKYLRSVLNLIRKKQVGYD